MTTREGPRPALVVLAAGLAKRYGGCKPLAPVGPHGEAIIDLTAGDALAGGFGRVVLVLSPATGPAITYHVQRCWPSQVEVAFAEQPAPLGTAHAVLCAKPHVGAGGAFAVVNADDLYGADAFARLSDHLRSDERHALVAYRLRDTIVTASPVTRGTCVAGEDGTLAAISERRKIERRPDGTFAAEDGAEPGVLDGDTLVSVNLWGFRPSIWPVLDRAVAEHAGSGAVSSSASDAASGTGSGAGSGAASGAASGAEVLLPEVVGDLVAPRGSDAGAPDAGHSGRDAGRSVVILPADGRCIGVTHADDLGAVRAEVATMIATGERPEHPWSSFSGAR